MRNEVSLMQDARARIWQTAMPKETVLSSDMAEAPGEAEAYGTLHYENLDYGNPDYGSPDYENLLICDQAMSNGAL